MQNILNSDMFVLCADAQTTILTDSCNHIMEMLNILALSMLILTHALKNNEVSFFTNSKTFNLANNIIQWRPACHRGWIHKISSSHKQHSLISPSILMKFTDLGEIYTSIHHPSSCRMRSFAYMHLLNENILNKLSWHQSPWAVHYV